MEFGLFEHDTEWKRFSEFFGLVCLLGGLLNLISKGQEKEGSIWKKKKRQTGIGSYLANAH